MLHDRHQLDVREAHLGEVIAHGVSELAVSERAVVLLGHAPPGAEVHFVDRPRSIERVHPRPAPHPLAIAPFIREIPHYRGGAWRHLGSLASRMPKCW